MTTEQNPEEGQTHWISSWFEWRATVWLSNWWATCSSSHPPAPPVLSVSLSVYVSSCEKPVKYFCCRSTLSLWVCFLKLLQTLSGCLSVWQFDSVSVWLCGRAELLSAACRVNTARLAVFGLLHRHEQMWGLSGGLSDCFYSLLCAVNQLRRGQQSIR